MNEPVQFLTQHAYLAVFGAVLADQLGLPLPSMPVLLAAGALAGSGMLNLTAIIVLAALAAFLSDAIWFELGRRHGGTVVRFACRASREPRGCVQRITNLVGRRRRWWSLVVAKFVPGLNVVTSPLAGAGGVTRWRFLGLNALGAGLFGIILVTPGYLFSHQLAPILALISGAGNWWLAGLGAALMSSLLFKKARRIGLRRRPPPLWFHSKRTVTLNHSFSAAES